MNEEVRQWVASHKEQLAGRVLEVGSFDVNGGLRDILDIEIGVDSRAGPGVDRVLAAEELSKHFGPEFDSVVCCETLEHVKFWREALHSMWDVLKPGGHLCITVPTKLKGRHNYPNDYWRWTNDDIRAIWPGVDVEDTWKAGIGWVVQKGGPLPDLTTIQPERVK